MAHAADPGSEEECRTRATRLLSIKARTSAELTEALARRGFAPDNLARGIVYFEQRGVLHDEDIARAPVAARGSRFCKERLKRGLSRRGVPEPVIARAVGATGEQIEAIEAGRDDDEGPRGALAGQRTQQHADRDRADDVDPSWPGSFAGRSHRPGGWRYLRHYPDVTPFRSTPDKDAFSQRRSLPAREAAVQASLRILSATIAASAAAAWSAAAAPVAALMHGLIAMPPSSRVAAVLSGGNVNLDQLRGLKWN